MASMTIKLDTLAWARKLKRAGIPVQHAEAVRQVSHKF